MLPQGLNINTIIQCNAATLPLKGSIESSKGIYSMFLSISASKGISINVISNDYLAVNQLNKFCRSMNLGDLIAVLGSMDFVLGSVDLAQGLRDINVY